MALEASNNQKNLNANRIYKETGQSPTQKIDDRGKTEKYAGIEGMKLLVKDSISSAGFMSAVEAGQVVDKMNDEDLDFFGKYKEFILSDFKGRGVPADVFIEYFRRLRQKTNETHGVEFNLQQDIGHQIQDTLLELTGGIEQLNAGTQLALGNTTAFERKVNSKLDKFKTLPFTEEEKQILEDAGQSTLAPLCAEIFALRTRIENSYDENAVFQAIREYQRTKGEEKQRAAIDLDNLVSIDPDIYQLRKQSAEAIKRIKARLPKAVGASADPASVASSTDPNDPNPVATVRVVPSEARTQRMLDELPQNLIDSLEALYSEKNPIALAKTIIVSIRAGDPQYQDLDEQDIIDAQGDKAELMRMLVFSFHNYARRENLLVAPGDQGAPEPTQPVVSGPAKPTGSGLRGRGIGGKARKSAADRSEGYKKPPSYKQLGRYLVNHHKLKDGILMVKSPSGAAVKQIPTQSVSSHYATALHYIAGGNHPPLDLYDKMSKDEKAHLHQVVKHSRVEGSGVPNPQKEDEDKELNRFHILKGEIIAGNDSTPLAREFKGLLIKLMRQSRIPRREGNEILEELLHLGH